MLKKLGLIVVVILVFVLSGCTKTASDQIEVNIFQFKVENKAPMTDLLKIYQKENPHIKINMQTVGGGGDYGAALRSKMASGQEPTIFNVGGPQDIITWRDKLANVSDSQLAALALPGVLDSVTLDGQVLALPMTQEGYGLLFNKLIFDQAGIDYMAINSWQSLVDAVELLDSKKNDLGIDAVFALAAKESWSTGLHDSNIVLSQEFNGSIFDALDSPTVEFKYSKSFKEWMDLQNKYSVQPVNSLDYSMQVEKLFGTGKVAIIKQGLWVYEAIASTDATIAANTGFLPVSMPGLDQDKIMVGIPMFWTINRSSSIKQQEAALDLLYWIYSSDVGKEYVTNRFNFISPYEGYEEISKLQNNPLARDISRYSEQGKTMNWVFMGYPESWGMDSLGTNLQKYFAGNISWDMALEESKNDWAESRKRSVRTN